MNTLMVLVGICNGLLAIGFVFLTDWERATFHVAVCIFLQGALRD